MTDYKGQCHCGQTEWTATLQSDQQAHILCHCDTCKSLSGAPYTLNQIIPAKALKITKGDDLGKYTYKGDSGKGVHCYYCKNCTSHVYHAQEALGPDSIVLRTGLLSEGLKNFGAGAEIYCKARLPWEKEVATSFEAMPPS
ncbi:hypothetical protein P153DRAFT_370946 [Dothidotthia symphoricarpi CBS 119687]|uniref:CENP-V/GFA domain-containing protein n=1 Tax=Dothidotthia symphoricarpi CBS 119687 TaxID=1392245 RepID=A0A6A5ZZ30_9PLEO|nr:uncharacterized protein P153DRAFT_370946 [Dothidotthia symphoricarpi CBS 119687]KAF2124546.1 hypothetical protein P153DRAFT_370946 [Dothidotthia symphoricarpi CBS 119687]